MHLFHALLGANARNLLTFDAEHQDRVRIPIDDNVGWLSFTHGITFANAVRAQCARFPELWPPALAQMACFSGRNAPYTVGGGGGRGMAGAGYRRLSRTRSRRAL